MGTTNTPRDGDGKFVSWDDIVKAAGIKGNAPSGTGYWQTTLNFTVPNIATYSVSGGSSVIGWAELR